MTPRCFPRLLAAILAFSLAAASFATRATAQDITISNPEILPGENTPDTPPAFKRAWSVRVPKALEKADKLSYVVITQYIDEKGLRLNPRVLGVDTDLIKTFRQSDQPPEFKPARIGRKTVGAHIRITAIFNPDSASPGKKDSIPRLLSVAPVIIKNQEIADLRAKKKSSRIFADLKIDETGAITEWVLAQTSSHAAGFKTEIDTALASWKFAPARSSGGKAIASTLTIPLLLVSEESQTPSSSTPPLATERAAPIYPRTMRKSGLVGQVTVSFEVNKKGDVQNPFVVRSNNPGFEAAAIEAVLKWKFKPGTKSGQPVTTKMQVPIVFRLNGVGDDAYAINEPSKKEQAKMPENLRYDIAPKVIDVIEPIYPSELARAGTKGKAAVAMLIDKKGRVTAVRVMEASHPEFGLASIAAAERHQFEPATLKGKPVNSAIKREFEFNAAGPKGMSRDDLQMISLEKKNPEKIIPASKIDQFPKAISQRPPVFPLGLAPNVISGQATVTFLIDTEGKVRLPGFTSATEPAFGYAAVQAIAHWRFEPATQDGKKVVTRVQVPINFSAKPAKQP